MKSKVAAVGNRRETERRGQIRNGPAESECVGLKGKGSDLTEAEYLHSKALQRIG